MERFISGLMNGNLSPRVVPIVPALLVITAVVLIRIVRWPRQDSRRGARRDHRGGHLQRRPSDLPRRPWPVPLDPDCSSRPPGPWPPCPTRPQTPLTVPRPSPPPPPE